MSTRTERGSKRTCQNPECGSRFYDLNRDPIVCPICESVFQQTAVNEATASASAQHSAPRAARRPSYQIADSEKPPEAPLAEGDEDALPAIEGEDEPEVAEEDETFLEPEEEEDGSDMENIIGGPVAEGDEPDR